MACVIARPPVVSSAIGVLSLLEEQENQLRIAALERLNEVVDQFWHEIADYLPDIESMLEDETFPNRQLAALVASKVFYHLEEYDDALKMALGAGQLFDLSQRTEYVEKIVAVALDKYITERTENFEAEIKQKEQVPIDKALEELVGRMFDRCKEDKQYKQGLGMALECRRLDVLKTFITQSDDVVAMLEYCQNSAMVLLNSKCFREQVLKVIIEIYKETPQDKLDYCGLAQCYFVLNDIGSVAEMLKELMGRTAKEGRLMAYQVAFDMVDNENQHFCNALLSSPLLKMPEPPAPAPAPATETTSDPMAVDGASPEGGGESTATAPVEPAPVETGPQMSEEEKENLQQLRKILSGRSSIDLYLEFLYRNNRADLLLLEIIKNAIDQKNSITHNGTVIAHALMQCGTTSDVFLRKNLEWLAKAANWAKFSATASLGVIHKGHIKQSKSILSTYLPSQGGARGSPYSEGGALYGMGLIHANHYDPETKKFLLDELHNSQSNEVLQHGACLGLGLVAMATSDEAIYEELKQTLYTDTAVAGEAAAYGIGLVMVGSANARAISELTTYAHETQHEKIIRACSIALALLMFRREEEAEVLIQQLLLDKDAILRYGACWMIAMAYVGTSHSASIRKLLHISVSDVSDDVRRAAVMALGFVMCNNPDQLPGVVKLLAESYNPHVRYAAAMALGIACAGSANLEAHEMLQPLMSDAQDFVRQGAVIALGLLYMQTSEGKTDRVKAFREKLRKMIGDKHEDVMTRFGAILANGIMDAGGRNSCASFYSKSGMLRRGAAIGFCLFSQMWYWFPLIHMFSLTLTPTALIGLNDKLKIPKNFSLKSNAKPSLFAYPEPLQPPKKEESAKAATAVLSTAAKAKQLKEKKDKEEKDKKGTMDVDADDKNSVCNSITDFASVQGGGGASVMATPGTTVVGSIAGSVAASDFASESGLMEVDEVGDKTNETTPKVDEKNVALASAQAEAAKKDKKDVDMDGKKDEKEGEEEKKPEPEPTEEILKNPCRVLPSQKQSISFPSEIDGQAARYVPLLGSKRRTGFLVLTDTRPEEPEDLFLEDEKRADDEDEKEPDPPAPFEWTDTQ